MCYLIPKRGRWWQRGATSVFLLLVCLAASCTLTSRPDVDKHAPGLATTLFRAETAIQDEWQHLPVRGETEYRLRAMDGRVAIRALGRRSASGLIRRVKVDTVQCPRIEWAWRVERIQADADIRRKKSEDVAASVFLLFGDPGLMMDPKPVPTLRYVWTNETLPVESVVDNPYLPGMVRSIVVESGTHKAGVWVTERRNLVDDFKRAFGYLPRDTIDAIALFTDNDQTKQPVEAYYGWARVLCGKRNTSPFGVTSELQSRKE